MMWIKDYIRRVFHRANPATDELSARIRSFFSRLPRSDGRRHGLRRATHCVEGTASIQLVCPYCGEVPTRTVIAVHGGDVIYRCENTYSGKSCGREFRGPA